MALLTLLIGVLLIPTLVQPFGRDQGNYAYAAWVWLEGAVPYRDVYVFKPPMTLWIHGLALGMFGNTMSAIRLLDFLLMTGTGVVAGWISWRLFGDRRAIWLTAFLFTVSYISTGYWHTAQSDPWINVFACAAVALGLLAQSAGSIARARLLLAAAGCAVGGAVLVKYTAGLLLLLPAITLVQHFKKSRREALLSALCLGTGFCLPILICGLWLMSTGAWAAFWECQTGLVGGYVREAEPSLMRRLSGFFRRLYLESGRVRPLGIAFGCALAVVLTRYRKKRDLMLLSAIWLGAGALSVLLQGRFLQYHYLMLMAPSAILGGASISAAIQRLASRVSRPGLAVPLGIGVAALFVASGDYPFQLRLLRSALTAPTLYDFWTTARKFNRPSYTLSADLAIADYLRATTSPDAQVYQWGYDPTINLAALRKSPSRFLYHYPLVVNWGNPKYINELLRELDRRMPEIFLVGKGDATPHVTYTTDDSRALLKRYPPLKQRLELHFRRELNEEHWDLYRRRDLAPPAPESVAALARKYPKWLRSLTPDTRVRPAPK